MRQNHSRYDNYLQTWTEPLPGILKAENDLLLAEAYMHNNKKTEALAILNDDNGTRNRRGQLPDLPADASDQEIYDAIYYEKLIECMFSSPFVEWCDMRRRDWLQPGSILHYPVPGSELELLGEEYYTFGGREGVEGEDYSALTSGWPVKNHPYDGWRLPGLSSVKY